MAGEQESIHTSGGEQLQATQKPAVDAETIQQPQPAQSPFVSKLLEVRTSSQADLQRFAILLNSSTAEPQKGEPANRNDLKKQLTTEQNLANSLYQQQARNQRRLEERLEELNGLKGLRKIPAIFEKRSINRKKIALQQEMNELSSRIQNKQGLLEQIADQERLVRLEKEDTLTTETAQTIQGISLGYERLLDEVLEDGTVPSEIRNSYLRQVIAPMIAESVEKGKFSKEKGKVFYQALSAYLDNPQSPEGERYQALYELMLSIGAVDIWDRCQVLLRCEEQEIVQQLAVQLAAADIASVKSLIEPYFFERAIEQMSYGFDSDADSFIGQIKSVLEKSNNKQYPDMNLWQAVKTSPVVSQVFGEAIKLQDQEYYQSALDESLFDNDGMHIDLLRFYPTPDAIRNLVILAAADARSHRTEHANWALDNLSKRPDWKQILDETEKIYPSLKTARPVLESWNDSSFNQYNRPGIQEEVGDFVLDVFENKPDVKGLAALAKEALTNNSILTVLVKRGVLPKQGAATLQEADDFLKRISKEASKRNENGVGTPYISEYFFEKYLRQELFRLLDQETGDPGGQSIAAAGRFEALAQAILGNKTNYPALKYLTDESVIERIKDDSFKTDTLPVFLTAYQDCPALLNRSVNNNLLGEFCGQFAGMQTVVFFRDMGVAYKDLDNQFTLVAALVGTGALTKERALELPVKAKGVLLSPAFPLALKFPQLFLGTDDGLDFFTQADSAGLFSLDKGLEARIGERIRNLQREGKLEFPELLREILPHEIGLINNLLSADASIGVNQQNWQQLLMGYVRAQANPWRIPPLSSTSVDKINALFKDSKARDLCLNGLRGSWLSYLRSGKPDEVSFPLHLMSEFIRFCGGAGPLSQLESLNSLINSVDAVFSKETTAEKTKLEICQGVVRMEDRFTKERWSNEDRTDFYNISRDILEAAPSLFSDYLALFEKLSPAQMRLFAKEIYPLYRTKLVLLEKRNKYGVKLFDKEQLVHTRRDIRNFADVFSAGEKSFEIQKRKLLEEIKGLFTRRFGIIKIPEAFTSEHMRSITNVLTYLANLTERTTDKETILGFYLSLILNGRWDDFRRGEDIDPGKYLVPEKSSVISKLLEERQRLNPLVPENLGIYQEDMPEFLKLLQQETQNMVVGNIETIDIKLTNIILNLHGLEDLDLYPDTLDKQRMQLLLDWGNKKVGSVAARMYQSLSAPGKSFQFSAEDTGIQQQITQIIQKQGLSLTPQTLKEHFQDGIKPLATVANLLYFIGDTQAEPEIAALKKKLKPSAEVIEVFKRLGEDFKPTSGAIALSQDLSYLDNLIVKREDELNPQERALLTDYIASVRTQVVKLEGIYDQIKNKFNGLKQGDHASNNLLLQDKLNQIDKIINTQTSLQVVTSTVTNNLDVIIENIRECLACTREGSNNDTNLTFGDMNKFYLYSQSETQQTGSISDQLVFVEPVTRPDGSRAVAFVLDRIYGTSTPVILENQIEAVLKKCRTIKQRFPAAKLFILVSDTAISTGGTSSDMLVEKLRSKKILAQKETVEVNVAESATGDHYVEFGGNTRTSGKRSVSGVVMSS